MAYELSQSAVTSLNGVSQAKVYFAYIYFLVQRILLLLCYVHKINGGGE